MINIDTVIKKHNGFFAFNNEQFKEGINKDLIPYVNIGAGGFVPKKIILILLRIAKRSNKIRLKKQKAKKLIIK
tara:strand:+ start:440 stop:661 length:222 start_codon:yes stop_codon:yes gene_type:complete